VKPCPSPDRHPDRHLDPSPEQGPDPDPSPRPRRPVRPGARAADPEEGVAGTHQRSYLAWQNIRNDKGGPE